MGFRKDSSKYGLITTAEDLLKFGEFILDRGTSVANTIISDVNFLEDLLNVIEEVNELKRSIWIFKVAQ